MTPGAKKVVILSSRFRCPLVDARGHRPTWPPLHANDPSLSLDDLKNQGVAERFKQDWTRFMKLQNMLSSAKSLLIITHQFPESIWSKYTNQIHKVDEQHRVDHFHSLCTKLESESLSLGLPKFQNQLLIPEEFEYSILKSPRTQLYTNNHKNIEVLYIIEPVQSHELPASRGV